MTDTIQAKPSGAGPTRRSPSPLRRLLTGWPLALGVLLGALSGGAYGMLKAPQYTATSYVVVVPGKAAEPAMALGFAQAYGRVATGSAVLAEAQEAAGLPTAELRRRVRVATSPDAPMVEISGTAGRAHRAAAIANAVARALTNNGNASQQSTGVRLTLLSEALAPVAPSSPSARIALAVGACAGGLVGCLVLLVRPRSGQPQTLSAVPAPAAEPDRRPATPQQTTKAEGAVR
jgi:capsular polysaccharide biosynthesis protein